MIDNIDIISAIANKVAEVLIAKQQPRKEETCKVKYFTVNELCSLLKISKATFYRHKDQGFIKPAVYVGRKPLFTQQSIDDYLNNFY